MHGPDFSFVLTSINFSSFVGVALLPRRADSGTSLNSRMGRWNKDLLCHENSGSAEGRLGYRVGQPLKPDLNLMRLPVVSERYGVSFINR